MLLAADELDEAVAWCIFSRNCQEWLGRESDGAGEQRGTGAA